MTRAGQADNHSGQSRKSQMSLLITWCTGCVANRLVSPQVHEQLRERAWGKPNTKTK